MDDFIRFEGVCFAYRSEAEENAPNVLEDFDLSIKKGEFTAILGHNGCGKSTVAKLCNGLEVPQKGRVTVDGMDTSVEDNLIDIRRRVGMIFQNPDNQLVATIVEDDVAFGPENLGVEPKEIRERVDKALKSVGMYDFREFEPHRLSGGQKQRVAIAGVLAMKPECIIFDESTAMLDPMGRAEVMKTVLSLKEKGITVLFITHFMDEAVQADRVVVMESGRTVLDGPPREVFSERDALRRYKLDVPDAAMLADMLRRDGIGIGKGILSVEELADDIERLSGRQN